MKKSIFFTALIFIATSNLYSQAFAQRSGLAPGFCLTQNFPDPFDKTTSIKFNLSEDCYVKMFVEDLQTGNKTLLVDGEMSAGKHGIIFKANKKITAQAQSASSYRCTMEAYSLIENNLLYSSEIKMMQK